MGRRTLLATGLVFLVLLVVTLRVTRDRRVPPESAFFSLKQSLPDTLTIAYGPDTTVLVPSSRGAGWDILRPVQDDADAVVVNALLKRLEKLPVEPRRFPLTAEKMDTYGMRHPRAVIRAAYRGGIDPDTLLVGAFTTNGEFDYVRRGAAPEVSLLESRLARSYLLKGVAELRDGTLLPFAESRAVAVEIAGPGGGGLTRIARDAGGGWRVERPYPGPADPARVREYLLSLNHMHVERFLDETGGSPVGGMTPAAAVSVALAGGDTVRALLGPEFPGEENLRYAISSRRRFLLAVPGKYLDVLLDAPDGLRQAAPFGFGLSRVDSVGIETGAYARIVRLAGAGEEGRAARETLGNWVLLRAARFAEADPAARRRWRLDPPAGRLTWWGGGDTLAVIEVGTPVDGLVAIHVGAGSAARPAEILLVRERELAPLWQALRDEARGAGSAP